MHVRLREVCIAAAVTLGFSIGVVAARSQENSALREDVPPELVSLIDQIVSKIPATDRSGVLVLDFKAPDGARSPFGEWLANQLSLALAKSDDSVSTVDRARLTEALVARHLSRDDMFDAKTRDYLVAAVGSHTVVMGSFGAADNGIGATFSVRPISQIDEGMPPGELLRGKIPFTGRVASNLGMPLASLWPKDGIFAPGAGGVGTPLCISCPRAAFPIQKPRDKPFKGSLQLMTVVTIEGKVTNVEVIKPLGSEFDTAAVAAVGRWKLKPAVNIDGNPVPVHQLIEVTFSSY